MTQLKTSWEPCEALEREPNGGQGNQRGEGVGEVLVVLGEAAVAAEPREGALDDPAPRLDNEALVSSLRRAISIERTKIAATAAFACRAS